MSSILWLCNFLERRRNNNFLVWAETNKFNFSLQVGKRFLKKLISRAGLIYSLRLFLENFLSVILHYIEIVKKKKKPVWTEKSYSRIYTITTTTVLVSISMHCLIVFHLCYSRMVCLWMPLSVVLRESCKGANTSWRGIDGIVTTFQSWGMLKSLKQRQISCWYLTQMLHMTRRRVLVLYGPISFGEGQWHCH